jgi:DNA repair exonuclease SbcCD ATPase subunit
MSEEAEFPKHLVGYMSSIIDGMQVLNAQIGRNIETSARFETELFKINRQYNTLTEMVFGIQAEMRQGFLAVDRRFDAIDQRLDDFDGRLNALEGRLDAISLRLEEIEATGHENAVLIKELRIENNRQHNEVLNALQIGLQNKTALEELTERVAELERRLSSL